MRFLMSEKSGLVLIVEISPSESRFWCEMRVYCFLILFIHSQEDHLYVSSCNALLMRFLISGKSRLVSLEGWDFPARVPISCFKIRVFLFFFFFLQLRSFKLDMIPSIVFGLWEMQIRLDLMFLLSESLLMTLGCQFNPFIPFIFTVKKTNVSRSRESSF